MNHIIFLFIIEDELEDELIADIAPSLSPGLSRESSTSKIWNNGPKAGNGQPASSSWGGGISRGIADAYAENFKTSCHNNPCAWCICAAADREFRTNFAERSFRGMETSDAFHPQYSSFNPKKPYMRCSLRRFRATVAGLLEGTLGG